MKYKRYVVQLYLVCCSLFIEVHQKLPNIIKIILTGQADEMAIERVRKQANIHRCLPKPWKGNELIETIRAGLAKL